MERGTNAYLSGLREKYFGELFSNASTSLGGSITETPTTFSVDIQSDFSDLLQKNMSDNDEVDDIFDSTNTYARNYGAMPISYEEGLKHIARYVESFESESKELWLVFSNEGMSLSKLIYTAEESKSFTNDESDEKVRNVRVLHPSSWWHWLRTTEAGQNEMKDLIWQLVCLHHFCSLSISFLASHACFLHPFFYLSMNRNDRNLSVLGSIHCSSVMLQGLFLLVLLT